MKDYPSGLGAADSTAMIPRIYELLFRAYGPQHWWPADRLAALPPADEIIIGAILTQNTAWTNVEHAIHALREAGCLNLRAIHEMPARRVELLIRPCGTYRIKTARLAAFAHDLYQHYGGSIPAMLGGELSDARRRLLRIHGIGPETADAILLYAGHRPTFVVDTYTRRVFSRHFLIDDNADYESIRRTCQSALTPDAALFNEYHALLVRVGKQHCRKTARCEGCPLADLPHDVPH